MTANIMRLLILYPRLILILILITSGFFPVKANEFCNPLVDPASSDTTLLKTLTRLAEKYDFKLSFPASLDRPVKLKKSMNLNRLVKHLTSDMNTVLKHKKSNSCKTPVLTQLIVLPVGKETEYVSIDQPDPGQSEEYIYIDNMELYVTNVLNGKQKADFTHMTPDQQEEYNLIHDTLKANPGEGSTQVEEENQAGIQATGSTD